VNFSLFISIINIVGLELIRSFTGVTIRNTDFVLYPKLLLPFMDLWNVK
jgi:hypothetical protein